MVELVDGGAVRRSRLRSLTCGARSWPVWAPRSVDFTDEMPRDPNGKLLQAQTPATLLGRPRSRRFDRRLLPGPSGRVRRSAGPNDVDIDRRQGKSAALFVMNRWRRRDRRGEVHRVDRA